MTATWTDIPDANLEPGAPARSVDALALRDNPIAIAERASGAPVVQVPIKVQKNPGDTSWTFPDDVTAAYVYLQGAGGGGHDATPSANAGNGGDTYITYNSITYTAPGGAGASNVADGAVGSGGTCTINENGRGSGDSKLGSIKATNTFNGYGGAGSSSQKGGAGAYGEVRVVKVPGQNSITLSIGAGGTNGTTAVDGGDGVIFIEY